MSNQEMVEVTGVVVSGHGVASGRAAESPYPAGTIALQIPFFRARGFDLDGFFPGTINLDLRPHRLELLRPTHVFRAVAWTPVHGPEDFSFARVTLGFDGRFYDAWLYQPHVETKPMHFQAPTVVEIIAPSIAGLGPGARVELTFEGGVAQLH